MNKTTNLGQITHQLSLIDNANQMIKSYKELESELEVRQYEYLKKKLILNLHKMLLEHYRIPLPKLEKDNT